MSRKDISDDLVWLAAQHFHASPPGRSPMVDDLLVEWTGQPRKVAERAIERAMARGVVECGVSTRTCWPERRPTADARR